MNEAAGARVAAAPGAGSAERDLAMLRRWFRATLAATLAFRLWLAWWLPLTGDEAYFVTWGHAGGAGFYDHPPMVGWILGALLHVSESPLLLRLPQVVLPAVLALGMVAVLRRLARDTAGASSMERVGYAAATAWLLVPIQVVNVLITTDTPLVFFAVASIGVFALAVDRDSMGGYAASGLLLGLAFLSKYFAVLVGFAYVAVAVAMLFGEGARGRRVAAGVALALAVAVPLGLANAWWNYEHCWTNVLFNAYNRNTTAGGFSFGRAAVFVGFVVYLTSPILLWQLVRSREAIRRALGAPALRALALVAAVPLALFAVLAPFRDVGLHWLFAFTPAVFAFAAAALGPARLAASLRYLVALSALHVLVVAAVAAAPVETWQRLRQYDSIVMGMKADELFAALKPYGGRYVLAADGFSPAALLAHSAAVHDFVTVPGAAPQGSERHQVAVIGSLSHHGRHGDFVTDWRALDGRDVLVVRKQPPQPGDYERYFRSVEHRQVEVRGATFHLVLGHGFRFPAYRDVVLAEVRDRFYGVPAWLPRGRCAFCADYFGSACPTR